MKFGRRHFLKKALVGSTGLLAGKELIFGQSLNFSGTNKSPLETTEADCIVIGAGMAGLVAARDLSFPKRLPKGIKTIVLEASHRIGGRILSLDLPAFGGPIEMGAEYLHRSQDPRISIWEDIYDYKYEKNILTYPRMLRGLMYYDGLEDKLATQLSMVGQWNLKEALFFAREIDGYTKGKNISAKEWIKNKGYTGFGKNLVDFYFTGHMPGPLDRLSVKGFAKDKISEQLMEWNEYGFSHGFTHFLQKIKFGLGVHKGKELDIRFNSPVKSIKYGSEGVEVVTKDGTTYRAKTAILTVSIGMLKSGEIEFQPPLPKEKEQALSWIEVGDRAKVVLKFKKRFWPDKTVFLTRIDENREMARTYFIPYAHDPEKNNVLSVLFAGAEADKIKAMSDRDVLAALIRDFDRMYPGFAKEQAGGTIMNLIEGASTNNPSMLRWQWSYDPYAKGSVSYLKSGDEENNLPVTEARQVLADPKSTLGLFWAGEATAQGSALLEDSNRPLLSASEWLQIGNNNTQPSSTHGAHHSGKRAAIEVLKYLNSKV